MLAQKRCLEDTPEQKQPGTAQIAIEPIMPHQVNNLVGGGRHPDPRPVESDRSGSRKHRLGRQYLQCRQQLGMNLDRDKSVFPTQRRQVPVTPGPCYRMPREPVAKRLQSRDRLSQAIVRDQDIEVAHEAPTGFRVKAINQPDGPLEQDRLDSDSVEADGSLRKLEPQRAVTSSVLGMDKLEIKTKVLRKPLAKLGISDTCRKHRGD
jgi:hypothetical protein